MILLEGNTFYNQVCVIIPTYNNVQTLFEVIQGVLRYTNHVIVVNDGSSDNSDEVLSKFPGLKIVTHQKNRGKGLALRSGMREAIELGYNYAISIDSDGQHFPEDLPLFYDKLQTDAGAVIIGARNMEQASVPGKSSFGNKFSNFWFKFETGISLSDTQSGFRLYPLEPIKSMTFFTRKYEFEIEVLVRLAWRGVSITEIPVRVFYAEAEKRISHFRPFQDFSRISVLNTVLVVIMLLYIKPRDLIRKLRRQSLRKTFYDLLLDKNEPDSVKALSIAVGIFTGIAPIWGFQLMTAIGLAFLLKLNKPLVIIAANISIPPFIPLILFLSHATGALIIGEGATNLTFDSSLSIESFSNSIRQYFLGAISLALAAATFFGLFSFGLMKTLKR